jgi:FkbM family methyltransferase
VAIGPVRVRVADDQPTFWDRVESGTWEPATLAALGALIVPGTVLLDIGAWVGPISLLGAGLGAPVIAVEADPAALDQLGRNLAANPALAARVSVLPKALSPVPGPVRMGARRKPGDSMSSALLAGSPANWMAEAVTPAELAGMLPGAGRVVAKIDIEGAEYAVLPVLGPVLDGFAEAAVLVSFHPAILEEAGLAGADGLAERALAPFGSWPRFQLAPGTAADRRAAVSPQGEWLFLKGIALPDALPTLAVS